MCSHCPQLRETMTSKHGPVVIALTHDPTQNEVHYTIGFGNATVIVVLPVGGLITGEATTCALFVGEHLPDLLSAASQAFMAKEERDMDARVVEELERMLRDSGT